MKRRLPAGDVTALAMGSNRPGVVYRLLLLVGAALAAAGALAAGQSVLETAWAPLPVARANGGLSSVITHTTVADFSPGCTTRTALTLSPADGGELRLTPTLEDYFDAASIDTTRWQTYTVQNFYTAPITVAGGLLTLDANALRSVNAFTQPVRFFEARATLRADGGASAGTPEVGFVREGQVMTGYVQTGFPRTADTGVRVFTVVSGSDLEFWARDGDETNPLTIVPLGAQDLTQLRDFSAEWEPTETRVYFNDAYQTTLTNSTVVTSWLWLYHQSPGNSPLVVDWVRAGEYATPTGTFVSCVQDAGGIVNWSTLTATVNTPAGTSVAIRTQTSLDNVIWSGWSAPLTSTLITSPSGRYFQYDAVLTTTNASRSPELQQVVISYFGPETVQVLPNPANVNPRATQQFTAQALDVNLRPVTGLTYTWQLMAPAAGSLNSSGLFTATATAAQYTNAISVTTPITGGGQVVGLASIIILNLPPTANANGPYSVNETAVLTLTGSGSDPNEGTVTYGWDLNNDSVFERPDASITNTWPDNGVFTVGFIVTDSVSPNLTTTVTTTVTVNNVAPTVSNVTNSGPITETSSVTVTVSASDVAGASDPLSYYFDCNNNGVFEVGPQSGSSASCTFGDNGSFTVPISVTDGDGGTATGATTVTVTNVAPVIASVTPGGPVGEGSPVTVTVSASDVAGASDPLQYAFDCDNNGTYETAGSGNAGACTFFDNGNRTVGVRVQDGDGGEATSNTVVTVNNVAPTIVALANTGPITEGLSATITLTATDPAGVNDPLLYAFSCDGDSNYEVGPQAGNSTQCLFGDNGVYTVRGRVSDDEGATVNTTTEVTVFNAAPVIVAVNVPPVILGNPSTVMVFATDAGGVNDPLQYEFDCDNNGTYEIGPQSSSSTQCPAFGSLGMHTVRVRVTDGDPGGVTTATGTANVVDQLRVFLPLVIRGN